MKIIPQDKVEKAANKEYNAYLHECEKCEDFVYIFKAGVEFAEEEMENLVFEFVNYVIKPYVGGLDSKRSNLKHKFNQFLKEIKNENKKC